jgi:hypothetical protein
MRRIIGIIALCIALIGGIALAQQMTQEQFEIMRLKAEIYDINVLVAQQQDAIGKATRIIKEHGDSALVEKFHAIGFRTK